MYYPRQKIIVSCSCANINGQLVDLGRENSSEFAPCTDQYAHNMPKLALFSKIVCSLICCGFLVKGKLIRGKRGHFYCLIKYKTYSLLDDKCRCTV